MLFRSVPEDVIIPESRKKPFGTAHALLSCKDCVKESFAIINADDFYGENTYKVLADFLRGEKKEHALVAFELDKTLTANGTVSRGIVAYKNGYLTDIDERLKIYEKDNQIYYLEDDKEYEIPNDSLASMNFWGFNPSIFGEIESKFNEFLRKNIENLETAEFLIPVVIKDLIKAGVKVNLLKSNETWFGISYKEDLDSVSKAICKKVTDGVYKENLWD